MRKLDEAARDIRQEEQKISRLLARSTKRKAKLIETQSALYRQLAELQLDKAASKEISQRFTRDEKRAHKILEQHDEQLAEIEKRLKKLDSEVAKKAINRQKLLDKTAKAQEKLNALKDKIKQQIEKDPNYKELQKKVTKLAKIAKQTIEKTQTAQKDSKEKGRPYRDDPLFMYLWKRKYGTSEYRAGNLTRWLDSKVAKLVKYHDARANFTMLNEIPLRLSEHAEYQQELADQAQDELDRLEREAIDKAGGKPMRLILEKSKQELAKYDEHMIAIEDERNDLAEQYRLLAEGQSSAFEKATKILAANLQEQNISNLYERARLTSNSSDNVLVKKIDEIIALIKEEQEDNKSYRARLRTLGIRRRELEDIEWEFKKSRFDDPRSSFKKNSLTGSLLSEFLSGAISAAIYWQQWQNNQSWHSGTSDWGGGIGLPRKRRGSRSRSSYSKPSRSRSSSSFSRPRSSSRRSGSRGSRRGGGFKTGGGF